MQQKTSCEASIDSPFKDYHSIIHVTGIKRGEISPFEGAHHCMGSGKSNDYQNQMAAQEMEGVSGIFEQCFSRFCYTVST
jgi:hypothetical protein